MDVCLNFSTFAVFVYFLQERMRETFRGEIWRDSPIWALPKIRSHTCLGACKATGDVRASTTTLFGPPGVTFFLSVSHGVASHTRQSSRQNCRNRETRDRESPTKIRRRSWHCIYFPPCLPFPWLSQRTLVTATFAVDKRKTS